MRKSASILKRGIGFFTVGLLLAAGLTSCEDNTQAEEPKTLVSSIVTVDVDGNSESTEVEVEDTLTLSATVYPDDASDGSFTWSSDDEEIATVDEDGVVTGVAAGETIIYATANDGSGVASEMTVTVTEKKVHVSSISITSKYGSNILKDEDSTITVTVLPENADVKDFTIKSSDESVLKITKDEGASTYTATGLAAGKAKITVVAKDRFHDEHKSAEFEMNVAGQKVDVESIALSSNSMIYAEGDNEEEVNPVFTGSSAVLVTTTTPAEATLTRTDGLVFEIVEGETLATLDEETAGKINFGEEAGTVKVKATATDRSGNTAEATFTFTVRKPVESIVITSGEETEVPEEGISLSREDDPETESADNKIQLSATINPDSASIKNLVWTSSNTEIIEVSDTGLVTAKKEGSAKVTVSATDGSEKKAEATFTVFIPVTKVTLSADKTKSDVKTTINLSTKVEPEDADDSVTYAVTSGNATVSEEGLVTLGDLSGDVVVTVTSTKNANKKDTITLRAMPDKTELKAAIEKANKVYARSNYTAEAKAALKLVIDAAQEEVANEDDVEADVDDAIDALDEACEDIKVNGIDKWDVAVQRRTNDQSTVKIYWISDSWKLNANTSIVPDEGKEVFASFSVTTDETVVASHIYWPENTFVTDENHIELVPAFAEPSLHNGEHTLKVTVLADDGNEYEIEALFTLAGETDADLTDAIIEDVKISLVDKRIKARAYFAKDIESAQHLHDTAKRTKYQDGAFEELALAISAAQTSLAGYEAESTTLDDIAEGRKTLSDAIDLFNSKKLIGQWDVAITRRTDDQSTVKISWIDDTWKLNARTSFVTEDGKQPFTTFKIDETVSHTYYPDGAADFVTAEKYISVKPAFHTPALTNGNHTLTFTVKADDENEYDVTVTFTLAGNTDADETDGVIDDVVIKQVDKTLKEKAKFQITIDQATLLADNAVASAYQEGAIDALRDAIANATAALEAATSVEQVKEAEEELQTAITTFHAAKNIDKWEVAIRQHDGDQYTVTVTWAKEEFAIDLNSVSNRNATFVTDGKASHTYWPEANNKVESNCVIFNPANNQMADGNALGEHTLVFDLKPLNSDIRYDVVVVYNLAANNSDAEIISTTITEQEAVN